MRVSCFNTEAGVAIDSFELNDFDEPSADPLRLRLHALIMAGSARRRPSPLLMRARWP